MESGKARDTRWAKAQVCSNKVEGRRCWPGGVEVPESGWAERPNAQASATRFPGSPRSRAQPQWAPSPVKISLVNSHFFAQI